MNKKSTGLLLSILGVLSLVLITAGVTYAFFSYTKEGTTENTISTGTITFYYDEQEAEGNGIKITDALPMDDDTGKAQPDNMFNFKITSTITGDTTIPYEVTARKKTTGDNPSTLAEDQIKLYLTANGSETAGTNYTTSDGTADGTVRLFSELAQTRIRVPEGTVEKTIYTGTVPAGEEDYAENFTLRMWIKGDTDNEADYSPYEFVLKTAAAGTTALNADTLITNNQLITSDTYYNGGVDQSLYERIAYVNTKDRTIYTVSQVTEAAGFTIVTDETTGAKTITAPTGFTANEQFYKLNNQSFTVTVNVYAGSATVVQGS